MRTSTACWVDWRSTTAPKLYHETVQTLAKAVLEYIRKHKLLKAGDRVGVAVSGGADSVALLRLLLELQGELGTALSVVHFNHKLRGPEADADEQFVERLASAHKLQTHCESGDVRAHAAEKHLGLEAAAREARYAFFRQLLSEGLLDRIATAHTLDDQAETVLLRLVRGAGTRGLAGIFPELSIPLNEGTKERPRRNAAIVRPLLGVRRAAVEAYLKTLGQPWREDRSNRDLRHMRNRVRHGILPRLERNLNPAVREVLAEDAEIARAEEQYWAAEVARVLPTLVVRSRAGADAKNGLQFDALLCMPLALQRRVLRAFAESMGIRLEFGHLDEVLGLEPGKSVIAPGNFIARLTKSTLEFVPREAREGNDYEYAVSIPGELRVPEVATKFEMLLVPVSDQQGYNPEHFLDCALLVQQLRVRNWRAGDRFWPAHTKAPKKVKELLQQKHVTGPERKLWPVVVSGDEIVWLRGFPTCSRLQPSSDAREAVLIRELPLEAG